tara:strand:- start:212 stop:916 length:705 start_codon:yes stop_codon:yes gene_type:complete
MSQTRAQLLKGFSNTSATDDAIIVNSSGNVAIGATVASTRLDVEGNNVPVEINSANSNGNKVQLSDAGTVRGYFGASSSASFLVSGDGGSEQFRVQAAGGISFNGDTAAINALDDYEEGTWTPGITSSSGTITTAGTVGGRYTKIGNVVHLQFTASVTTAGTANGAYLYVTGCPFPASTALGTQCGAAREQNVTGDLATAQLSAGNTTMVLLNYDNGGTVANSVSFQSTLTYRI